MATTLNPKAKLFAVYNQNLIDRGLLPIDPDAFEMQPPTVFSGPQSIKNTRAKVIPKSQTNSFGTINFFWNRENLATALTTPRIVKGTATTVHEAIAAINDELGVEMTTDDFVDGFLGSTNFVLQATPTNLVFTGSVTVTYYP